MAQKQKLGKNSTPTIADPGYFMPMAITGHNAAEGCGRELFQPTKDGESLAICNKKIILDLDVGFFVDIYM